MRLKEKWNVKRCGGVDQGDIRNLVIVLSLNDAVSDGYRIGGALPVRKETKLGER